MQNHNTQMCWKSTPQSLILCKFASKWFYINRPVG